MTAHKYTLKVVAIDLGDKLELGLEVDGSAVGVLRLPKAPAALLVRALRHGAKQIQTPIDVEVELVEHPETTP